MSRTTHRSFLLATAGVLLLTLGVYWQSLGFDFLTLDDPALVTDNPPVLAGLTWSGLRWALTTGHVGNWVPLTWLSHMLDCQIWGVNPWGHHLTSLLLHCANLLVLVRVLWVLTGARWRSLMVAGLFALHPLNVESVVWVAQRKTVLSTLFILLAILAYERFVDTKSPRARWQVTGFLFLALLAKPIAVTVPFLFLLLDFWPLRRWEKGSDWQRDIGRLVVEKIPWFLLIVVTSALTFVAQRGAGAVSSDISLPLRLANAAVSYVGYLRKALWPFDLGVLYPHPNLPGGTPLGGGEITGALCVLVVVTALCLWQANRRPANLQPAGLPQTKPQQAASRGYGLVGWLWFLGALVPVIGLVQIGDQAMADRYFYLPGIGLFIALVWWVGEVAVPGRALRRVLPWAAAILLLALAWTTANQASYWRSSRTLYQHTLSLDASNPIILQCLGRLELYAGNNGVAEPLLTRAVELRPFYVEARAGMAEAVRRRGDLDTALQQVEIALALHRTYQPALQTRALIRFDEGDFRGAVADLDRVLEIDPGSRFASSQRQRALDALEEASKRSESSVDGPPG
ncbi:MAG: tetratricopeptide repeat protein [Thermoanaerobaculia bacterium]|nr:tetratricopeptide repeat protein [Thermoanaerobaculia bacterium]